MPTETNFFYANAMETSVSVYDLSLKFIRTAPLGITPGMSPPVAGTSVETKLEAAETLIVAMSPSHAKAMLPSIIHLIHQYEVRYGRIPLPPEQQAAWDAVSEASGVMK